jgi:hypothetical protein
VSIPARKIPAALAEVARVLAISALAGLQRRLSDGIDTPPPSEFPSLNQRRDG